MSGSTSAAAGVTCSAHDPRELVDSARQTTQLVLADVRLAQDEGELVDEKARVVDD